MMELNRPQLPVSAGSPLPRRTGRAGFPHPALARVVSYRKHSQRFKPQVLQVSIESDALPRTPAALTAPVQMVVKPVAEELIEVVEGSLWIAQAKVARPSAQIAVQSPNQLGQRSVTLMLVDELAQPVSGSLHRFTRGSHSPVAPRPMQVAVIPKGVAQ